VNLNYPPPQSHIIYYIINFTIYFTIYSTTYYIISSTISILFYYVFGRQRDPPVRGAGYEPFDSISVSNRSQKSQEISIRRSSNEVRTLRGHESCRAEFWYATTPFLTTTIHGDDKRQAEVSKRWKDTTSRRVDSGDEPEVVTTSGRRIEDPSTALVYWNFSTHIDSAVISK